MRIHSLIATLVIGIASSALPSHASLLLNPAAGTVRLSDTVGDLDKNDGIYSGPYYYDNDFFGVPLLNPFVTISVNGFLRFGDGDSQGDYTLYPLGTNGINRIAPMWANFTLGTNGQIIEEITTSYYAVTWLNMEHVLHPGTTANFQAVLIHENTTLNGNEFLAGDILFSYGDISIYPVILETLIGLENNDFYRAALPDHEPYGGWHSYNVFGDFPVGEDQYIRFRPNAMYNYDVTIQTVIPEPTTYGAWIGVLALAGVFYRKRFCLAKQG